MQQEPLQRPRCVNGQRAGYMKAPPTRLRDLLVNFRCLRAALTWTKAADSHRAKVASVRITGRRVSDLRCCGELEKESKLPARHDGWTRLTQEVNSGVKGLESKIQFSCFLKNKPRMRSVHGNIFGKN